MLARASAVGTASARREAWLGISDSLSTARGPPGSVFKAPAAPARVAATPQPGRLCACDTAARPSPDGPDPPSESAAGARYASFI